MGVAPRRPCTTPGCPYRTTGGRCPRCTARQPAPATWTQLYGRLWPRVRLEFLLRHPWCTLCGRAASVADHHPRGIKELLRLRVSDPNADEHLRPLCKPCHDTETPKHHPGGWNTRRR